MRSVLPLLVALAIPAAAFGASSVANELTISSTQPTAQNPRSGTWSDRLSAAHELSYQFELHGGLNITHDNATVPRRGAAFGPTGGNIFLFDLGADWMPTEHLLFAAELSVSPKASQLSATIVTIEDQFGVTEADAHLRTVSSSVGALLAAGWMSDGDKPEVTAVDASFSLNHTETVQSIAALETRRATVTAADVRTYCSRNPEACPVGIEQVLQARLAKINQARFGLNVSQTIRDNTDLSVGGGYYVYDRDPLEVGYFSLTAVGRPTFSMGEGVPIAPVRYTLRTGVTRRFFHNTLSLGLWASYARYVEDQGFGASLGTRIQVRFSRSLRVWVTLAGNDDVDWQRAHSRSGSASAGLRWSF